MKKKEIPKPIKLDFDEVTHELTKFPWPYKDESVEECSIVHKLEYIPAKLRIKFMEELWRVLTPTGKVLVIVCYWTSPRSIQDPTYEWPPFCEQSFLYFNKEFRKNNKLSDINCDFEFTYGYQLDAETASRNQETQVFWIKHYANAAADLQLTLSKPKKVA